MRLDETQGDTVLKLLKTPRLRRTMAAAAATLTIAGGATLTTAGTANATSSEQCGPVQGPWYGWSLQPCVDEVAPGVYYSRVHMTGGDTDVRIYTGVYDKCNGVTYGIPGDSPANDIFPGSAWFYSYQSNISCSQGVWGIARVADDGVGAPWAWSQPIYG
ncbi:hypothetical protein OG500_34745 [Kitasatospora sp. NBC_01250]|uniref:hypothetical protein n=1 Tax=Kitasatospora sp. NBC_01250 TaxID=2903571 RepID=UPI002E379E78|nr:hypothetical protein [Kitasatospora sp. NBC_01250]